MCFKVKQVDVLKPITKGQLVPCSFNAFWVEVHYNNNRLSLIFQ